MSTWTKIRDTIESVAPSLAVGLSGPAAPLVQTAISAVLGTKNDPVEVHNALQNPDNLIKLKQLENDRVSAYLNDSANARTLYKGDSSKITNRMAAFIVISSFALAVAVITGNAPGLEDPKVAATAGTIVGLVFRELKHVLSFFFGAQGNSDG